MSFLVAFFRELRARHARPKTVATAVVGKDASIVGRVEAILGDEPTLFSRRLVVAADERVDQRVIVGSDGRGMPRIAFRTEATHEIRRRFAIVDDAGDRIHVVGRSVLWTRDERANDSIPQRVRDGTPLGAFLRSNGIIPGDYMGIEGAYAFFARVVAAGDRVVVFGRVAEAPYEERGGYRTASTRVRLFDGTDERPTYVRNA